MKSIDEIKAEAEANWVRQRALINQQRKEAGLATVRLMQAADERPLFSAEYQTEFQGLRRALSDGGVEAEAPFMVMDSAEGGAGYIGELLIQFSQIAGPVVGVVVGAWLQSRSGRKVRVKIGDIEIEASTKEAITKEELERLLQRATEAREMIQPKE